MKKKAQGIKGFFTVDYPSPKKAVIFSAILPGSGQIYNRKYWKLPLVYGTYVGLGLLINNNYNAYQRLKTAYENKLNNRPLPEGIPSTYSAAQLKSIRDQFRYNLELSYIGAFFAYVLTGVDSFVDAHLKTFNVNDDLSLHLIGRNNGSMPAIGLALTW